MKMAAEDCSPTLAGSQNQTNSNFICGVVEGFYGRPWTIEQRKDLFVKVKSFGINTYMYAPKDDLKHRAYWRELYTVEEADHLTTLIQAAKESGITLYYALSPGLDIAYSNPKDVISLKRKLEQVSQFGCVAFALLFDDIEPEISESDKEVFQSFAAAQVSITNDVYQTLGQPKFLFCPTEYCATRAVPNVQNSEYLCTVGAKLLPDIDVMWTGSKVISKTITVESILELSEVLKRPPVIWDNLHANDYDQKRLFLGPYSGRSTDLIPHLRGVLTNPNCEYEPNFIAIHTLAQWSRCSSDAKSEQNAVRSDIKLESESENGSIEDIPTHLSPTTYHPKKALKLAILDWITEFGRLKNPYGRPTTAYMGPPIIAIEPSIPGAPLLTCTPTSTVTSLTTSTASHIASDADTNCSSSGATMMLSTGVVLASVIAPRKDVDVISPDIPPIITKHLCNSLADEAAVVLHPLEPMDCNPSPCASPKPAADVQVEMDDTNLKSENEVADGILESSSELLPDSTTNRDSRSVDSAEDMQTESLSESDEETRSNQLTYDDVALLVDMFYLPFEHGGQGLQFLYEFQWLKTNAHLVSQAKQQKGNEMDSPDVSEWYQRARKFEEMTQTVGRLLSKLMFCKNRSLLYDLYPYVWDVKGAISLLNSYVKWLGFSKGYKEAFHNGDQEPWLFRGGLTGELQRLLPVETVSDLFAYKPPDSPSSPLYTIRPYLQNDESSVYEVCQKTADDSDTLNEMPNIVGDDLVGGFLCLSPEYCFVVEDESGICGYALAAMDAVQFQKKLDIAWNPELRKKYPLPDKISNGAFTPIENIISSIHGRDERGVVPENVYKTHSSVLRMNVLPHVMDMSVPKRLLTCVLAALKANGSHGVFCELAMSDKKAQDSYSKLGFVQIQLPANDTALQNSVYLGRAI